jgi:hypothetical protein
MRRIVCLVCLVDLVYLVELAELTRFSRMLKKAVSKAAADGSTGGVASGLH